jgi:dTDP-4-dehydrorhamnose reductase
LRIAVTGSHGQLGSELVRLLRPENEVIDVDRPDYDITDLSIVETLASMKPDRVIHAAAMTDVDGCARDPELAFLVNGFGTRNVAQACLQTGADLCYISTNEVFDGAQEAPYREWDTTNPINPYGASKLAGERFVRAMCPRSYIVRTAWLFGPASDRHFVSKIIAAADRLGSLRVVADEVGSPTYAPDLAQGIVTLLQLRAYGVYHLTNAGSASRYEFARAVLQASGRSGVPVDPIQLSDWPRDSVPPKQSRLHNTYAAALGITLRPWQEALAEYLQAVP